ncbi:sarcosine oxidase subunit gamma [Actinoplanes sp. OR16]|uniref:sarcosine oxidase subunit gamma n=1 Tax=Actinoplanes sp. OR16 TaxID=946334 RepID=UPI000F6FA3EB|nr:sarcosine oxidase subunit gamma family protein [Actinoplanes sp. OR16]BBH68800.1 sarcosine oxidase subunit gamma [Actinoplanes sp. OR16]
MAESPLAGVALPAGVTEVPFLAQATLRADPGAGLPPGALGVALPPTGGSASAGELTVLSLGPDEWLVLGPPGARIAVAGASVVDVSAQRTTLDLGGPHVRELLAFGCSLDLHPRVFAVGDCAQTTLARCPVIVLRRESGFRILVRASFAAHLAAWLTDAADGLEALPY